MPDAVKRPSGDAQAWSWGNSEYICCAHHEIAGGEAGDMLLVMRAGTLTQDIHVDKVAVSLENAPGDGKTVSVAVTDGTNTMTVEISGAAATFGSTTTNAFDLDVSVEDLTITITATAGTAAGCCTVFVVTHQTENA